MNKDLLTDNFPPGIDLNMIKKNYIIVQILFAFALIVAIIGLYNSITLLNTASSGAYKRSFWNYSVYPYIRMVIHILFISSSLYLLLGYRKMLIAFEQDDVQTFNSSIKFFYTCNIIVFASFLVEFGSMAIIAIK